MFNWDNMQVFNVPYKFAVCDNFIKDFDDTLFPDKQWQYKNRL